MKTLAHAGRMVRRNFRSYAMLSVTIVLSFALLLGYLVYTDAMLYNRYKELFAMDRHEVYVESAWVAPERTQLMIEKAKTIGNTKCFTYYTEQYVDHTGYRLGSKQISSPFCVTWTMIPNHIWRLCDGLSDVPITWLDGKPHSDVTLASDEILMDEQFFRALGLDKSADPRYTIQPQGWKWEREVRVVGTIPSSNLLTFAEDPHDDQRVFQEGYGVHIVSSQDLASPMQNPELKWTSVTGAVLFYTDSPEKVFALANSIFGSEYIFIDAVCQQQDEALLKIRTQNQTKAVIAVGLLILLGINLYSSFSNALNDRKFEIGVKRAVGASQWAIVRQFLYESILVLLADILLAVALVVDMFIVYKFVVEHTPNELGVCPDWILYISPYSMAMFGVCAVTLTVVFSLIFAYKSTQVEIVSYLKAE